MMQKSLRTQLLVWLLILLLPLLLLSAVATYYTTDHFARLAYDRSLLRKALSLADQVEVEHGNVVADIPPIARELIEYDKDDLIFYVIRDPKGKVITGNPDLLLPTVLPKANEHVFYDSELEGNALRVVAYSLSLAGTRAHGIAEVVVGETLTKHDHVVGEIIATMMMPQLLIVILTGLMVHFGVKRGLSGLNNLREAFSRRSLQDLRPVDESGAPLEVQPLLRAMNDLMQRLYESIGKQQRFVANASHQLRTPLAGLKNQAELALREKDPDKIHHALQQIQTGSSNLAHLVGQLLVLASAEPEAADQLEMAPLNFTRLVQEITSDWVPRALAKKIDLGFSSDAQSQIIGNTSLLCELLNNLLDNAILYTPENGCITVSVRKTDKTVELAVEDSGIGIPEDKLDRVFERFYRVLGTGETGSGLGLVIVKEIAARHHATVTLERASEAGGTLVKVFFPLSSVEKREGFNDSTVFIGQK